MTFLLLHVTGAKLYDDIGTVYGVNCDIFRESCNKMGLIDDYNEWKGSFRNAFRSNFVPPSNVFATILAFCHPSSPIYL